MRKGARDGAYSVRVRLPPDTTRPRWHYSKARKITATSDRDARRQAQEITTTLRADPTRGVVTLAAYARQYHETRVRLGNLAPQTITRERAAIELRIVPHGDVPVNAVTTATVRAVLDAIANDGGTPGQVWSTFAVLRRVLRQAVADGHLSVNPCDDATILRTVHEPHVDRTETLLEPEQAVALVRAAMGETADGYHVAVTLAGTLGLRRGEALGLAWRDVHLDAGTADIVWQLTASKARKRPKASSERSVRLPRVLVRYLTKWRETQRQRLGGTWTEATPVCADRRGGWLSPTNFGRWRRRWYVRHGVGRTEVAADGREHYVGPNLHSLRHDHVSRLLDAGLPLPAVSERVGHSRASTTANVYAHARVERSQDAADIIDGDLA